MSLLLSPIPRAKPVSCLCLHFTVSSLGWPDIILRCENPSSTNLALPSLWSPQALSLTIPENGSWLEVVLAFAQIPGIASQLGVQGLMDSLFTYAKLMLYHIPHSSTSKVSVFLKSPKRLPYPYSHLFLYQENQELWIWAPSHWLVSTSQLLCQCSWSHSPYSISGIFFITSFPTFYIVSSSSPGPPF